MLLYSSILVFSSSSWLMIWIFMEINSLAMCSLISKEMKKENEKNNQALIYLIIQLTASIIFIMTIMSATENKMLMLTAIMCLMMKTGMWPFHLWYFKTLSMMKIKHKSMALVMTWQKIIPMMLLPYLMMKFLFIFMSVFSMITPIMKLKKNSSFKTIMISSSLNNNSWFILTSISSIMFFLIYFLIYSISLFLTFNFFKNLKTKTSMNTKNFWESMMTLANMGGIPPMMMFLGKLMIFYALINSHNSKEVLLLMMIMACLFMYHYMWSTMNFLTKMTKKTQLWKLNYSMSPQLILFLSMILPILMIYLGFS